MAQQTPTPTLSKWTTSDQRFIAGPESPPKNDVSCSMALLATRKSLKALRCPSDKVEQLVQRRQALAERVRYLKQFSRGVSDTQKHDMGELKEQGWPQTLKAQFPEMSQRQFQHHELYDFLVELRAHTDFGEWGIRENAQEMIVYTNYGSVFPGLRFKKRGDTYQCVGFNFDIRLAS